MILEYINSNLLLIVDHMSLLQAERKINHDVIDKMTSFCNKIRHENSNQKKRV